MGAQSDSSIYFYNPVLAPAILFAVLYTVPTVTLFWQTCIKCRALYLLCLPIGGLFELAGYISRAYSVQHVTDIVSLRFLIHASLHEC